MAYLQLDTKSCISSLVGAGAGVIESIDCPSTLKVGDIFDVQIKCKNTGTVESTFAFLFCASSPPHTSCNVEEYVSEAFILKPDESKDIVITITMPDSPIAYVAELQRWV